MINQSLSTFRAINPAPNLLIEKLVGIWWGKRVGRTEHHALPWELGIGNHKFQPTPRLDFICPAWHWWHGMILSQHCTLWKCCNMQLWQVIALRHRSHLQRPSIWSAEEDRTILTKTWFLLLMAEIQRSPVEVGSFPLYLQCFSTIPGRCLGFLPSTVG